MNTMFKPTKQQLLDSIDKVVPDLIGPNLRVLFCGINPGLYSAATEHHFARPGNRFWPALHAGGFTDRILSPFDERELLTLGLGITNVVKRASVAADELSPDELRAGGKALAAKVKRYKPRVLAVLGVGAFRAAFGNDKAVVGRQSDGVGETAIWVLPNPSGLNAHYKPKTMGELFGQLRAFADQQA